MHTIKRIAALFIATHLLTSAYAGEYTRSFPLPTVDLTLNDYERIIEKIHEYQSEISDPIPNAKYYEAIHIKTTLEKYTFADIPSKIDRDRISGVITDITYSQHQYSQPIDRILIFLNDTHRSVEVSGNSPEHVDALLGTIDRAFHPFETTFSGRSFRVLLLILLFFFLISLQAIALFLEAKSWILPTLWVITFVTLTGVMFLPTDIWFSGAKVRMGMPSFTARNSGLFSLWGLIITITIPIISIIYSLIRKKGKLQPSTGD